MASQRDYLFEGLVGVAAAVEGTVEGDREVACGLYHTLASCNVNITLLCQSAYDYAMYPHLAAELDVAAHCIYLLRSVTEAALARTDKYIYIECKSRLHYGLYGAVAGGYTSATYGCA